MKLYTLITWATNWIGLELAKILAKQWKNIALHGRNQEALDLLKSELIWYGGEIATICEDLKTSDSAEHIVKKLNDGNVTVDVLVNNAWFGDFWLFKDTDVEQLEGMIMVNIFSLTKLTRLLLPSMLKLQEAKIINISSVAAFFPGPTMSVYYASKAYVLSFSEALSYELSKTWVQVQVICPGPTKSNFQKAAGISENLLFNDKIPSSAEVAVFIAKSMHTKKIVRVHGLSNYFSSLLPRFFPRSWVLKVVGKFI